MKFLSPFLLTLAVIATVTLLPGGTPPACGQTTQTAEKSAALDAVVEDLQALKSTEASRQKALEWIAEEETRLERELSVIKQNLEGLQTQAHEKTESLKQLREILSVRTPPLLKLSPSTETATEPLTRTEVAADGAKIELVERPVDFGSDIFPILERSCFGCHGPEKQRSELRLDSKQVVFEGGLGGPSVVPGKGEASLLFRRVAGLDGEDQMPPKGDKLTGVEMGLIRAWIDQGASWPENLGTQSAEVQKHWAYVPPVKASLPQPASASWAADPIDLFILERLEKEGLSPSPPASKEILIRRASLDLTGLPPTLEEVDAFLADDSPEAFEKVVDRLLASSAYGERWARVWLDLARYADTNGYEKDLTRSLWPWRDWVIEAFNKNLPFDEFTLEQIAGDLLPNASQDQLVATGFHRNTMLNDEGGIDPEEFRIVAVKDRVDTTAAVWLGTTLGCAQCHNHKYDPFTQEEYYQFLGFFNSTQDMGVGQAPELSIPTPEQKERLAAIDTESKALETVLETQTVELESAFLTWEKETRENRPVWSEVGWTGYSAAGTAILTQLEDRSFLAVGPVAATDVYHLSGPIDGLGGPLRGIRIDALPHETLPAGGPGRMIEGKAALTGVFACVYTEGGETDLSFSRAVASKQANGSNLAKFIGDATATGWRVEPGSLDGDKGASLILSVDPSLPSPGLSGTLDLRLEQSAGGDRTLGRFRVWVTSATDPASFHELPRAAQDLLAIAPENRNATQETQIRSLFRQVTPQLSEQRQRLATLRAERENLKVVMTLVMAELPEPRETHVLVRGNFLNPGRKVDADVPRALPDLPEGAPRNRLGLAQWLVDRDNPLTARVLVNRLWSVYFGQGLVKTSEDFGTQGDPPTHPELLDWLAVELMDRGWDLKAMHKLLVTSSTYRQSSRVNPELLEIDPHNTLYARGPRFRMEAEMIRDNALAISGLLSRQIGGPSVFPPQPEGIWDNSFAIHDTVSRWIANEDEQRYRRGLYTFLRRTAPYPTFQMFDAPKREVCTIERSRTTTPLQALATLNDPAFFEAAGGLAVRLVKMEHMTDAEDRLAAGFRLCTARNPSEEELEALTSLYEQALETFRADPEAAGKFIAEARQEAGEEDPARMGALILVSNVLLNLDETLMKG